ncbi:E3 ubiquitin-protein ligase RING1a [Salix suchowensis]|nr:E3 ubiquitin-protein ligase RING1a [Salix suchowensis]
MPAQKRSRETLQKEDGDALLQQQLDHTNSSNSHEQKQQPQGDTGDDGGGRADEQSDRSQSSSSINEDVKEEYVVVKLSEIRKEVQCPICLGIIRKTRTVMECLHRFCRECIDKSMRLGNNECPACRTHCASRRSLRDDPNYDTLISALYPNIDKYEEEELAFQEEEKVRNKQIQATIAQTFHRQAEALTAFARRTPSRFRDAHSRGRRNYRMAGSQGSDDNEDANGDGGKDSSSADEHSAEVKPKGCKKWAGGRSAAVNADGGGDENDSEVNKESAGASSGLVGSSERLSWGKNGMRSHTRYGSANSSNVKNARSSRISKLADYLRNLEGNDNEQRVPSLQRPYLRCRPTLSISKLCQYVAFQTSLQANEVEIYLVREMNSKVDFSIFMSTPISKPGIIDPCKDQLQVLEEQETVGGLKTNNFIHGHLNVIINLARSLYSLIALKL